MYLRSLLESQPETLLDLTEAAEQRYLEAVELAGKRKTTTAIYLFGYSAEIILKISALRFDGATGAAVAQTRFPLIRRWMVANQPTISCESFHSLIFWLTYLREQRKAAGKAMERNLDGLLVHHVQRIYFTWWVGLRYRGYHASPIEMNRVFRDVTWLRETASSFGDKYASPTIATAN